MLKHTIIFLALATATAHAQAVRHVPPADAEAGSDLEIEAEAPATTPTLVAHYRSRGTQVFQTLELVRKNNSSWVAVVPASAVAAPGIDYYVTAGDTPVFASPEWPHTIAVYAPAESERRTRDALRAYGRRSSIHTMGEWVEYGGQPFTDNMGNTRRLTDHFYRLDADFSYRLWTYPLEEIRIGYTRMLGVAPDPFNTDGKMDMNGEKDAGFKVGGWFELGLAAAEGVRVDGRMIVMANADGFAVGTRGEVRLGNRDASHVAVGAEYLAAVGANGFFRLGWGTVPHLPMSATVEITNLPARTETTAVRLYYDIGSEVRPGFRLGIRVGYAARNQSVAGFTGGAGAAVEF